MNASGVVTKRYEYDAFGNEVDADAADANPFRYCGEYYDVPSFPNRNLDTQLVFEFFITIS